MQCAGPLNMSNLNLSHEIINVSQHIHIRCMRKRAYLVTEKWVKLHANYVHAETFTSFTFTKRMKFRF